MNESKETPADLATRAGHTSLATQLETKIVFEVCMYISLTPLHSSNPHRVMTRLLYVRGVMRRLQSLVSRIMS